VFERQTVPLRGSVPRQQDEGRRVRRLGAERQVQKDERERVKRAAQENQIGTEPEGNEDGLKHQEGPAAHEQHYEVVHVVLPDGRAVLVSPGHPLPDGRPVAALRKGDAYAGSGRFGRPNPVRRRPNLRPLPSGGTGIYWANGIELGSTLFR
jgi:hypothetical protein